LIAKRGHLAVASRKNDRPWPIFSEDRPTENFEGVAVEPVENFVDEEESGALHERASKEQSRSLIGGKGSPADFQTQVRAAGAAQEMLEQANLREHIANPVEPDTETPETQVIDDACLDDFVPPEKLDPVAQGFEIPDPQVETVYAEVPGGRFSKPEEEIEHGTRPGAVGADDRGVRPRRDREV